MSAPRSDALVFFGVTGDLVAKKIFPALHSMARRGHLDAPVVGVARRGWTLERLKARARESIEQHGGGVDETAFAELTSRLRFVGGNYEEEATYADWASTGTKDPTVSDLLYVVSLAAPHTVNTMPEQTLRALADHGEIAAMLPHDGGDAEEVLGGFRRAGIDLDTFAATLQADGAGAFVKSWEDLLACIGEKSETLRKAG